MESVETLASKKRTWLTLKNLLPKDYYIRQWYKKKKKKIIDIVGKTFKMLLNISSELDKQSLIEISIFVIWVKR
jgi:peptidyl-tRNA hydrolase